MIVSTRRLVCIFDNIWPLCEVLLQMIFQHMKVKDGATALMIVVVGTALLKIEIIENEVFFIVKV